MAVREYRSAHRFPPTFLNLLALHKDDARILDVGGGDRRLNHLGYVNLEIAEYSTVDVLADTHTLPFKRQTFDIILCQAAIEHLQRPWLAAHEMHRVCKIGGFVYVDAAFMQPMHAFPSHYFNTTIEGLRVLFDSFVEIESGIQPYQMPSYTVYRILSEYLTCFFPQFRGAIDTTHGDRHVTPPTRSASNTVGSDRAFSVMLALASIYRVIKTVGQRTLQYLDRYIDPSAAQTIAAGVYFFGRRE